MPNKPRSCGVCFGRRSWSLSDQERGLLRKGLLWPAVSIGRRNTFTGELFDYSDILVRIRAHFDIPADDPACVERDYGTRCGFGDGEPKGARFIASLTTQQISIRLGKRP